MTSTQMNDRRAHRPPRYEVCFNNGYWKVFDKREYRDVARHLSERQACDHCARRNPALVAS